MGQMKASHSNSFLSTHNKRSSSLVSKAPSLLHRTRCCGRATAAIGSICRKPSLRTVSRTPRAEPSSSWALTAMRRASSRLTTTLLAKKQNRLVDVAVRAFAHDGKTALLQDAQRSQVVLGDVRMQWWRVPVLEKL